MFVLFACRETVLFNTRRGGEERGGDGRGGEGRRGEGRGHTVSDSNDELITGLWAGGNPNELAVKPLCRDREAQIIVIKVLGSLSDKKHKEQLGTFLHVL